MPTSIPGGPIGSDTVETVHTLSTLLGGGPVAVFCAVLILAVCILFVLLIRAKDAHLRTAVQAMGLASQLELTVRQNTESLNENTEALEALARTGGKGGRQSRSLVAVKSSSGQEGQS